jgi:hypothetical protein
MKLKLFLSHFYNRKAILLCKLHRYGRFWVKHMALYCAVCYNKKKLGAAPFAVPSGRDAPWAADRQP